MEEEQSLVDFIGPHVEKCGCTLCCKDICCKKVTFHACRCLCNKCCQRRIHNYGDNFVSQYPKGGLKHHMWRRENCRFSKYEIWTGINPHPMFCSKNPKLIDDKFLYWYGPGDFRHFHYQLPSLRYVPEVFEKKYELWLSDLFLVCRKKFKNLFELAKQEGKKLHSSDLWDCRVIYVGVFDSIADYLYWIDGLDYTEYWDDFFYWKWNWATNKSEKLYRPNVYKNLCTMHKYQEILYQKFNSKIFDEQSRELNDRNMVVDI